MAYEPTASDPTGTQRPAASAGNRPDIVEEAAATASELGRSAERRTQRVRTRAAAGLDSAARSVHAGAERAADAGHSAGDALASGAEYVREHDVRDMMEDVMDVVRSNPGVALLSAAALGYLVGRVITRAR